MLSIDTCSNALQSNIYIYCVWEIGFHHLTFQSSVTKCTAHTHTRAFTPSRGLQHYKHKHSPLLPQCQMYSSPLMLFTSIYNATSVSTQTPHIQPKQICIHMPCNTQILYQSINQSIRGNEFKFAWFFFALVWKQKTAPLLFSGSSIGVALSLILPYRQQVSPESNACKTRWTRTTSINFRPSAKAYTVFLFVITHLICYFYGYTFSIFAWALFDSVFFLLLLLLLRGMFNSHPNERCTPSLALCSQKWRIGDAERLIRTAKFQICFMGTVRQQ